MKRVIRKINFEKETRHMHVLRHSYHSRIIVVLLGPVPRRDFGRHNDAARGVQPLGSNVPPYTI
jgi:hypothetical protein